MQEQKAEAEKKVPEIPADVMMMARYVRIHQLWTELNSLLFLKDDELKRFQDVVNEKISPLVKPLNDQTCPDLASPCEPPSTQLPLPVSEVSPLPSPS